MPKKTILFIAPLVFLCGCYDIPQLQKTGLEENPLPSIDLLLTDSATHINTSQAPPDKPAVLFYFDPNCHFCQGEIKDIIENISSLRNIHFYILTSAPLKAATQFYKAFALDKYPNLSVGLDLNHTFRDYFTPRGYPYTVVYRRDKKLTKAFLGEISSTEIEEASKD